MEPEYTEAQLEKIIETKRKLGDLLILISEVVNPNDYHFVFYLLILDKEGLLETTEIKTSADPKTIIKIFVLNLASENANALQKIAKVFEPIINRISDVVLISAVNLLGTLNTKVLSEDFHYFFDFVLYQYLEWQGKYGRDNILPIELSLFVYDLVNPIKNANVYNPFAGLGTLGLSFIDDINYFSQESNEITWAIASLRMLAYEHKDISNITIGDSINDWNPSNLKFDCIIASPPWGMRLERDVQGNTGMIKTSDHFLIDSGLSTLNDKGKLILFVNRGFLANITSGRKLRQYLIDNDLLELVISFPKGLLLQADLPFAIIVLNKDKQKKGIVRFVDATQAIVDVSKKKKELDSDKLMSFVKSSKESTSLRIVSNEKIKEYQYNFNSPIYFRREIIGVPLLELITPYYGDRINEGEIGKFVRIRDLKDNKMDYNLNQSILSDVALPSNVRMVSDTVILFAMRWNTLKPTYFKYSGTPIFITNDIAAFKVKESKVDVGYLVNELYSEYFIESLNSIRNGGTVPTLPLSDLLNLKVELQPIEIQLAEIKAAREAYISEKLKEVEELMKVVGVENDVHNQNTFLRHSIAGNIANLRGAFKRLKSTIDNQILKIMPNVMSLKDNELSDLTFEKVLKMMERDIEKISMDVQRNSADSELLKGELMPLEILTFLKEYVSEVKSRINLNYELALIGNDIEDEAGNKVKVFINGNKHLLKDMMNNIIENAEVHAFDKLNPAKNKIEITVWIDTDTFESPKIYISVSNTGKRLPENFNSLLFETKGSKAGENAGNGFGGWYINQIISKHGGSLEIDDEQGFEGIGGIWATSLEIQLPILNF